MKLTLLASSLLSLAATITAAPTLEDPSALETRTIGCLNSFSATQLVNKYISILQNQTYQGQSVTTTANQIIAPNYVEYSDSILSLENAPLGNTPSATSRDQWVSEVTAHPETGIQTIAIMTDCPTLTSSRVFWFWNFPNVGSGQYEAKGFNLLTVNFLGQITEAQIEFNSIAWGLDTQQIYQYCPTS